MDEESWRSEMAPTVAAGFVIDDPRYKYLYAWNYVLHQLLLARLQLERILNREPLLIETHDIPEVSAFFHSAVMSYGRCFVSAAPGLVSLQPKNVFRGVPLILAVHDELMDIRHNLVAHTGTSPLIRVTIATKEDNESITIRNLATAEFPPTTKLTEYKATIQYVETHTALRLNRYHTKLSNKIW